LESGLGSPLLVVLVSVLELAVVVGMAVAHFGVVAGKIHCGSVVVGTAFGNVGYIGIREEAYVHRTDVVVVAADRCSPSVVVHDRRESYQEAHRSLAVVVGSAYVGVVTGLGMDHEVGVDNKESTDVVAEYALDLVGSLVGHNHMEEDDGTAVVGSAHGCSQAMSSDLG